MSIQNQTITIEDKRRLVAVLAEMKARGLNLPSNVELPKTKNENRWNIDENGYFIRREDSSRFKDKPN